MSMGQMYWRMSGVRSFFFLIGVGCLVSAFGIFIAAISKQREWVCGAKCSRNITQLATAQENWHSGRKGNPTDRYFTGIEPKPDGSNLAELQQSDATRVYMHLMSRGLLDGAYVLACPSDPFVAPLDITSDRMNVKADDLPAEGTALGRTPWAAPDSAAATENGRTWFSYSMHSASPIRGADFNVRTLSPKIPLFSDRNPECEIFGRLGAGDSGPTGNSWNHNREGQSVAFADGHTEFLKDAGKLELPLDPARPQSGTGFDHLFNDEPSAQGESRSARKCIPAGTFGRSVFFGAWMTD